MTRLSGNWLLKSEPRERVAEKAQRAHDFLVENGYALGMVQEGKREFPFAGIIRTRILNNTYRELLTIDLKELELPAYMDGETALKRLTEVASDSEGLNEIIRAMRYPSPALVDTDYFHRVEFSDPNEWTIATYVIIPSLTLKYNSPNCSYINGFIQIGSKQGFSKRIRYHGEIELQQIEQRLKAQDPYDNLQLYASVWDSQKREELNERMTKGLVEAVRGDPQ